MIVINARFLTQPTTGVQRFAAEISKRINKSIKDVEFVSPKNIINHSLAEELNVNTDLPLSFLKGHLWEQISLPLFLKSKKKPLLISLTNTGPWSISNQIYTLHDLGFIINPNWYSFYFSLFYRLSTPILLKNCKHVITVSYSSKKDIIKYYGIKENKISVVYNSFTFPTLNNSENNVADLCKKEYILSVSSFNPRKNLSNLINAFLEIHRTDINLYLVGNFSKNYRDTTIIKHERIHYLTNVNDNELITLYKNSKLFVYPSHYEGFGIPILEAMYFNLKICASNIDCFNELFLDKIFYFDQNSIADIKRVIKSSLETKQKKNAYRDILSKYSWESSSHKVKDIINNVITITSK